MYDMKTSYNNTNRLSPLPQGEGISGTAVDQTPLTLPVTGVWIGPEPVFNPGLRAQSAQRALRPACNWYAGFTGRGQSRGG